ncbi:MAG: MoaD/ThiS family protein [Actinomycetota bacterium]
MITLRMFASVREAAGRPSDEFEASDVEGLLSLARARYGVGFESLLHLCAITVNGRNVEAALGLATRLNDGDEVALLPPVSGG